MKAAIIEEIMKLQISQSIGLRQKCEQLLDVLIEFIVRVTDYVVVRHITLAELILFAFSGGRAVWFLFFGVSNANFNLFFSDRVWTTYFLACNALHFAGFFFTGWYFKGFSRGWLKIAPRLFKPQTIRTHALYANALAWGVLIFLAAWSQTSAPAVPAYVVLFGSTFFCIVRLERAKTDDV